MIFKVTHITPAGLCRKAMVTALSVADAQDQVLAAWGLARSLACMCLAPDVRRLQCV